MSTKKIDIPVLIDDYKKVLAYKERDTKRKEKHIIDFDQLKNFKTTSATLKNAL